MAKTWEDDEPVVSPFGGSPTILRTLLGAQLKRLREARRLSLDEAAHTIRSSHSKISRLEAGRVRFKDRDLADLLSYYGVTDEVERQAIRDLATRANARDWWHDYSDILPSWFQTYVGLEETAIQIRAYEDHFVHGLLQIPDYARAVTQIGHPDSPDYELERRVALRLARQAILTRPTPPFVWVILDESVLRRPIGGTDVLRAQIKHLAEMAERPHVAIQIMPLEAGGHAAAGGSFSVLRFAETDLPDVVYLEQLTSALYLDKQEVLDHYQEVMNRLSTHAMTPAASLKAMKAACRR